MDFIWDISNWCLNYVKENKLNLVDGSLIGIKTTKKKTILLDDLMEEAFLDVDMDKIYGIYIPKEEFLRRTKYQWFTILPTDAVLECNTILSKFFISSIVDYIQEKDTNTEIKSLIAL